MGRRDSERPELMAALVDGALEGRRALARLRAEQPEGLVRSVLSEVERELEALIGELLLLQLRHDPPRSIPSPRAEERSPAGATARKEDSRSQRGAVADLAERVRQLATQLEAIGHELDVDWDLVAVVEIHLPRMRDAAGRLRELAEALAEEHDRRSAQR